MSLSQQIELTTIQPPDAVAKSESLRRLSAANTDPGDDDSTLPNLERVDTVTSKSRTVVIIASVTLTTGISTLLNGVTTVALPHMAAELAIPPGLLFWPSSIQALTSGCSLLLSGSICDALGSRFMYLVGCVLQAAFILGCGLSQTSAQIILFRALSGIAVSLCLPSAVAIITRSFVGKRRDLAFASMGGGQPVGFAVGLAIGGVLTDSIGWRWCFFISAIFDAVLFATALWGLPTSIDSPSDAQGAADLTWREKYARLKYDIDWVGALIASASLAMMSYVFAYVLSPPPTHRTSQKPPLTLVFRLDSTITGSRASIKQPSSIALLSLSFALIPTFIYWVGRQEKLSRPAIIPNSLWRNRIFTAICLAVFLTWGSFNALETILTFYFQEVQHLSATEASLRFLPAPISGALSNIIVGLIVHRVPANWLVLGGTALAAVAPLVMAFATPTSPYWTTAFIANIANPTGADSLFTVANLLITSVFPPRTQALAGGVFNTVSQIGKSVGLALNAVLAASVTAKVMVNAETGKGRSHEQALMEGYNATFWFCFALIVLTFNTCLWGLRNVGKVGHKRD